MTSQAQEKFKLGLERLKKAGNDEAGNDADLLGLALSTLHGALEDQFRDLLSANTRIPTDQRDRIRDKKQVQWKELVDLMQQYEGLSSRDRSYILDTNRIRNEFAHGGECQVSYAQVKQYAQYVGQSVLRNVGQSAKQSTGQSKTGQSTAGSPQKARTSYNSTNSTAYTAQAQSPAFRSTIRNSASKHIKSLYQGSVWWQWLIAHFIGVVLSLIFVLISALVVSVVFGSSTKNGVMLTLVLIYTSSALAFGITQQIIVVSRLVNGTRWAMFTAIGGALLGAAFASLFSFADASHALFKGADQLLGHNSIVGCIFSIGAGAATGLAIGFMQWQILKENIADAKSWIWVNVAEGALFWGGATISGVLLFGDKPGFNYLIFLAAWAAMCRSITGKTLTHLLSQVRSR